jgi:phosphomannomutase
VDRRRGQRAAREAGSRACGGCRSPGPAPPRRTYDFLGTYVDDLPNVVDLDAIKRAGVRIGADPLGGASRRLLGRDRRRHGST